MSLYPRMRSRVFDEPGEGWQSSAMVDVLRRSWPAGGSRRSRGQTDGGGGRGPRYLARFVALVFVLVVLVVVSFPLGRYPVDMGTAFGVIAERLHLGGGHFSAAEHAVVLNIRLPRVVAAVLVGAALSSSGAAYQSVFRNLLVSPSILGVSAGAGFGASIALLFGLPAVWLQVLAFAGGLTAAAVASVIGSALGRGSVIVLILGGLVVSALFEALIGLTEYVANPDDTLPSIIFWLLGGLNRVSLNQLVLPAILIVICLVVLYLVRWPVTVLAAAEGDARTLGVNQTRIRMTVIIAATLLTATVVSIAGLIGWVGLVVPQMARFLFGPSFTWLMPGATVLGAVFLLIVDDVARSATSVEVPLGILTALIGAPCFVAVLAKARHQWL